MSLHEEERKKMKSRIQKSPNIRRLNKCIVNLLQFQWHNLLGPIPPQIRNPHTKGFQILWSVFLGHSISQDQARENSDPNSWCECLRLLKHAIGWGFSDSRKNIILVFLGTAPFSICIFLPSAPSPESLFRPSISLPLHDLAFKPWSDCFHIELAPFNMRGKYQTGKIHK